MSEEPAPPGPVTHRVEIVERKGNGLAVAGLVLGIVGVAIGLVPLFFVGAFICGALALIFGVVAWRAVRRLPERGRKGMAVWATILGVAAIALGGVGAAIVTDAFNDLERDLNELQQQQP